MKSPRPLLASLASICLGITFSACDSQQAATSPTGADSRGSLASDSLLGQWYLYSVDSTTVLDRSIPLTFGDTAHLHGSDGCNSINGAYFATSTTVSIPALASTTMNCIDSRYPNLNGQVGIALQSIRTWKVLAGELDLSDSMGTIRLRYKRTPSSSIDPGWFHAKPCTVSVVPTGTDSAIHLVGTDTAGLSLLPVQITSALSTDSGVWLDVLLPHPGVEVHVFTLDSMRLPPPVEVWDTVWTDTGAVVRKVWGFTTM